MAGGDRRGAAARAGRRAAPAPPSRRPVIGMLAGRRTASLLLAAGLVAVGLVAAGAGASGLVLTRHPRVPQVAALTVLPAPTGRIEVAPPQGTAQVAEPTSLIIPAIGVRTSLVHLG